MTDLRLRQAARKARASTDQESRWLSERLRAGDLSSRALELAAYCGHVPAQDASPRRLADVLLDAFPVGTVWREAADNWANTVMAQLAARPLVTMPFSVWVYGLGYWGRMTLMLAGLAAARMASRGRLCTPSCGGIRDDYDGARIDHDSDVQACAVRNALDALAIWIACPCEEHGFAAGRLRLVAPSSFVPVPDDGVEDITRRIHLAAKTTSEQQVRSTIQDALVPFALDGPPTDQPETRTAVYLDERTTEGQELLAMLAGLPIPYVVVPMSGVPELTQGAARYVGRVAIADFIIGLRRFWWGDTCAL